MRIRETALPGVLIVKPRVFQDERGFFMETFQQQRFEEQGLPGRFVQDNFSRSRQGTIRGLHYQIEHPQAKLIQVVRGEIFDVAVDLRRDSPHFGEWVGVHLNEREHQQVFIPAGFAHGFCVLSEVADFFYKCTDFYFPEHERTLKWDDPQLKIEWPLDSSPTLSEKDRQGKPLDEADCYETSP